MDGARGRRPDRRRPGRGSLALQLRLRPGGWTLRDDLIHQSLESGLVERLGEKGQSPEAVPGLDGG
ncbi:MAG: hypothetical protein AAFU79_36195, partial [Myxococcota bacterium]